MHLSLYALESLFDTLLDSMACNNRCIHVCLPISINAWYEGLVVLLLLT